ncbi:MAG: hypothetical protein LBL82_06870 [Oscillospiraceae bacterium]|jgi:hypothetical protein|nr:hypothetical protein [Oscillospiraceae bacterium]
MANKVNKDDFDFLSDIDKFIGGEEQAEDELEDTAEFDSEDFDGDMEEFDYDEDELDSEDFDEDELNSIFKSRSEQKKESKLRSIYLASREKLSEIFAPVVKFFSVNVSVKISVIALSAAAVLAISVVTGLWLYGTVNKLTTDITIEQFQSQFNAVSASDVSTEDGSQYLLFGEMMKDTTHNKIEDEDVAALRKGEDVKLFDDFMTLRADIKGDNIVSLSLFCKFDEFVAKYTKPENPYANIYFGDEVTMRYYTYAGMILAGFVETEEQGTAITSAYSGVESALSMAQYGTKQEDGSITYKINGLTYIFMVDPTTNNASVSVELQQKTRYTADFSWFTDIFKAEEKPVIPVSDTNLSGSDLSATDAE